MAEAYSNLPWIPDSSQFLRAILAGGEHSIDIARLRSAANMASQGQPVRVNGLPHVGGGGFRLPPVQEPAEPTGPHLGGISGSPILIDPQRENQAPVINKPFSLPGDTTGRKFVSDASGDVVDYVAPVNTKTPFGGQQSGYWQFDPETGKAVQIVPPADKPATEQKYAVPVMQSAKGAIRTMQMTPSQLNSKWSQLPEFAKTNTISQLVRNLGRDKAAGSTAATMPNGTRVRNKITGETATWMNGQLVPDKSETAPAFEPGNGRLPSGFMHFGQNVE